MTYKSAKVYTGSEWVDLAVNLPSTYTRQVNTVTSTSYSLTLSDAGSAILMNNSSSMTLTVPADADVTYAVGTTIVVYQLGTGVVTLQGDTGVTLHSLTNLVATLGQYSEVRLLKIDADEWLLSGDLD